MTSKLHQLTVIIAATVLAACGSGGSQNPDHPVAVEDEHSGPERPNVVDLSPQAAAEAGIVTASATQAPLRQVLSLPAELRFDADRVGYRGDGRIDLVNCSNIARAARTASMVCTPKRRPCFGFGGRARH